MEKSAKAFDVKKFMSNNAIIILIVMLAILTGFTTKNFFTITNFKNLVVNVSPRFIIACGVSGCLITKGTDLSAGRAVGLAACLSAMMLQSLDYSARMFSWMPDIPWPVALVIVMIIMGGFAFHRHPGYADHHLRPVFPDYQQPAYGRVQEELSDRGQRLSGSHPLFDDLRGCCRRIFSVFVQ